MKMRSYTATCKQVQRLNGTTCLLTFSLPEDFTFVPGQFITMTITVNKVPHTRSYSIASPPRRGEIDLLIRYVENGAVTPALFAMKPGDRVQIQGPFGRFTLKDTTRGIICIATGTGIAPFRAIIPPLLTSGYPGTVKLLEGHRTKEHIIFQDLWSELDEKHTNFDWHLCLSREETWKGDKGRVQDLLERYVPTQFKGDFYLCGVGEMVLSCQALLLERGITRDRIHSERYS